MGVGVCHSVYRSKNNLRYQFLLSPFNTRFLVVHSCECYMAYITDFPSDFPSHHRSVGVTNICVFVCYCVQFCVGSENLNSGPQAITAISLNHLPSSFIIVYLF